MPSLKPLFSSKSADWQTPQDFYQKLDDEFHFTLDPCPVGATSGLSRSWAGERVYCNPPYGRQVAAWLAKAREAELAIYLLPARTDTAWWHDYAMKADEIRFIRGRLYFTNALTKKRGPATFPSVVIVFRNQ